VNSFYSRRKKCPITVPAVLTLKWPNFFFGKKKFFASDFGRIFAGNQVFFPLFFIKIPSGEDYAF
jgi:hypothetical protein